MAHPIVWSTSALNDVREAAEHIVRDSPSNAAAFVRQILASVDRLADYPLSGRAVPEASAMELREVLVSSYRVLYEPIPMPSTSSPSSTAVADSPAAGWRG